MLAQNTSEESNINKIRSDSTFDSILEALKRSVAEDRVESSVVANRHPMPAPTKRPCRPTSRKFAHPCNCGSQSHFSSPFDHQRHDSTSINSSESTLPHIASTPMYLYDTYTKKCLPTSRNRDMLLKGCHPAAFQLSNFPNRPQYPASGSCFYSDLVCDPRHMRCVCKQPSLHLYYTSEHNYTSFGCVPLPINQTFTIRCNPGQVYNSALRDCQKIFDVSELSISHHHGPPGTQLSFITIVFVWVLLLILIFIAKLRKLRNSSIYTDRRGHLRSNTPVSRHRRAQPSWLHPFMAAVNGHPYLTSGHHPINEHANYTDTDFFLGGRRLNEALNLDGNLTSSEQSLNTLPPPKFEEIYPSYPTELHQFSPPPPSNEDLPTYDEAMKLQNTQPPDRK